MKENINMEKKSELAKMSYQDLEKEEENVLTKLSNSDLALDEATSLYEYGKSILKEMDKRLQDLAKSVTDTVKE
ncbi:MAG: exodeoxyribonuclease VII small subunit [Bacilli bacterium]|jgi:exodeoxyribonuclease VII small subunit